MAEYIITTDSACDIKPEILKEWGVSYCSLTFRFLDDNIEHNEGDMPIGDFYNRMRQGGIAKTAAVNSETFVEEFEKHLSAGLDILHLGFSSGLSTTYNSARIAGEQLKEKYPDRKIIVIDTLSASAGFGLLLYLTVQKKKDGATIDEAAQFANDTIHHLCHWFTVDDLEYLKRGGRISAASAFVGSVLGIKPVMHMDDEGHLINVSKVRGRKTAVTALADKYTELALDKEHGTIFISQGDCMADAELCASIIKQRHGNDVKIFTDVGTVIGSHTGPGVLALFFVGKER